MVANIHCVQGHLEETISTLKFATRMMKVKNEAVLNSIVDPTLRIKRLEKDIRDLKQELAMHDTLANRGRVNYDSYSNEEIYKIETLTNQYLEGEIEDIEQIDSLRMIREIFNLIKNKYKNTNQHIESLKRQIEENPEKFKAMLEEQKAGEEGAEEPKEEEPKAEEAPADGEGEDGDPDKSRGSARSKKSEKPKEKREPMDKQAAFLEFKSDKGSFFEEGILQNREDIKVKRVATKDVTIKINSLKKDIDSLKFKLDKKEEERKINQGQKNQMDFDEDEMPDEEIIDEEELVMLKEMKDLKRDYRDKYTALKGLK